MEGRDIDAARPRHQVLEAALRELVADRLRHHQHRGRRRMEAAHEGVAPRQRQADAGMHVFGKARVVGRGEGDAAGQAEVARRPAQRALGHQMDGVGRIELQHVRQPRAGEQREPDLGIGRAGQRAEAVGPEHFDVVAVGAQELGHGVDGAHHAVDLRPPGVGDDGDAQSGYSAAMRTGAARRGSMASRRATSSAQRTMRRRPSKSSTSAVQLSTQSPSLQ